MKTGAPRATAEATQKAEISKRKMEIPLGSEIKGKVYVHVF